MRITTAIVWGACLASLAAASLMAGMFVMMATGLDPATMITAGIAPWRDALVAVSAWAVLLIVALVALRAWHSRRFRPLGVGLIATMVGAVTWSGAWMIRDYF